MGRTCGLCQTISAPTESERTVTDKVTELKACPFCGGDATLCSVVSMQHEIVYVVKCDDPNCVMSAGVTLRQTISQAEEAWNRRVGDGNA